MKIENPLFEDGLRLLAFLAIVSFLMFDPLGIIAADALAEEHGAPPAPDTGVYQPIIKLLSMIFILAVLIEVALSVLFRWRVFLRYTEGRGWKVPIAFVVSFAIVVTHGIDLPGDVVAAFSAAAADGGKVVAPSDAAAADGKEVGYLISALIIAGGSSSVNSIFEALGWRNPVAQQKKSEKERQKTQGRLWVQVTRPAGGSSVGQPLSVSVDGVAVGMIPPGQDTFGDKYGHTVRPGSHTIDVTWTDQAGNEQKADASVVVAAQAKVTGTLTLS